MRTLLRKSITPIFIILIVAALLWFLPYASRNGWFDKRVAETSEPAAVKVRVARVVVTPSLETQTFLGVVKETQAANLSFRVAGTIIESHIAVGTHFNAGDVVARLDSRDYDVALLRVDAEINNANAALRLLQASASDEDIATIEAQLAAATSQTQTAEINLERFASLLAEQATPKALYDLALANYDTAKAQRESLTQQLAKARRGARQEELDVMLSRIKSLEVDQTAAKNAISDTVLYAPFGGYIVEKFVDGHENIAPGIPVLSFVNLRMIDVTTSLPEEIAIRSDGIKEINVEFESYSGVHFPATIKEIGHAIQRGRQTYPLEVRVDVDNGKTSGGDAKKPQDKYVIYPGMIANVKLGITRNDETKTYEVPLNAIRNVDSINDNVWIVDGKTVTPCKVEVKRLRGGIAEVTGEINDGDVVVTAGVHSLRDGLTVEVVE
ncbi:MAG: efflux RND transporter periplasmic adaptor subunit [Planctomycetaceae bacterium]|jgi:RND family efflux transporter MFP subunit|nr:efflux RND transporter periplasmic adaptor subunit [Planctomycetaceae bacterium]